MRFAGHREVALLVALALTGCLHSTGGKVGATVVGVGALSGFIYGIACADYTAADHNCESTEATTLGAAIVIAIVGGTLLAVISEVRYEPSAAVTVDRTPPGTIASPDGPTTPGALSDPDELPTSGPALYEPIAARDPMAHRLTLQAHSAAVRGECASISIVGQRVRTLDAEYYTRVFAADPPIARCLH